MIRNAGLYTSPHLVAVRERIRINGKPLSEEDFTHFFFEVWDLLQKNTKVRGFHLFPAAVIHDRSSSPAVRSHHHPLHAKLLSIPYAHGFLYIQTTQGMPSVLIAYVSNSIHQVDATILEVGIGGRSDSTNIVPKPVVTGVTALGYDHTRILGDRLSQIANQKGGIFKVLSEHPYLYYLTGRLQKGVPALTVEQPQEGMTELHNCATEQGVTRLSYIPNLQLIQSCTTGISVHNCRLSPFHHYTWYVLLSLYEQ